MRSGLIQQHRRLGDRLVMRGAADIIEADALTGRVLSRQTRTNLIVDAGLAFIIDRLKGDTFSIASYFAVGTNVTAAAPTQTGLINEVFRAQVTTSRRLGNTQLRITCFIASGQANGYTLQEFGIFGHPDTNTGPMLCRLVYNPITKNTSSTITYIWTGTLAAA